MALETADKDASPTAASAANDEIVGASENSSQNTEESTKNSPNTEDNEIQETKQEEQSAVAKKQDDVEMDKDDEKKDGNLSEKKEEDVEMEMEKAKDESEEKNEPVPKDVEPGVVNTDDNETKTEEEESTSDSVENVAADEKASGSSDVEMKEATQEAKSEHNDETASPTKKQTPAKANNSSKVEDSEVKDSTCSESSSPKRKEAVQKSTSKTSNGVNGSAEPAAKKQKMDPKTPEKMTDAASTKDAGSPSLMLSRDDMAKMEEDSGRLKFDVITNDGTDEHMIQLTTLKNIFAKQLPKMPKEYIVRLVFDKNHRSMLLLKNGTHVIGGICYRPFEKNQFAEIAFCAINASDQVKGYGTRLMNHLKEYVKTKNITHFLTYADNYAIGYFKKQGFTKSVSMARPNWYGYIKDYDGGTLMECTIHTQINYLRITSMIHQQRKAIQDKIQDSSRAKTVYPGLTAFAEGRLMDIYMVPGVKEAGWSQATIRNNRIGTRDQGSLKSQLSQLLKAVSNHRSAWPFHEPVDTSVVVDYLDFIKDPVDLQLISKRIDSGVYISKAALKADLLKMCDNCTLYNTPDTNYYKAAVDLKEFIQSRIQIRDHK
ncbi:Intraflagellar Transport protein 80 [Phytophthora nicotianae]|uniref:histone acetyltransferase n=1 Tax=Phytophthora nicotianae TaxID=4792 RepID=A0A0W8DN52_PHYNI|nr:Intraflagellar Transport protein 80 [Phytophthora nicotianae]